jgi:hypothetical protein
MPGVTDSIASPPRGVGRDPRLDRAAWARRRLGPPRIGRAWINGREVGGANRRFNHLAATHD